MRDSNPSVAFILGGSRGFGRAIAERLVERGWAVAIAARTETEVDYAARALRRNGGRSVGIQCDARRLPDVEAARRSVEDALGPVSLLVYAAGVYGPFGPLWEVDPEEWWAAQEVHLRGALNMVSCFVPGMVRRNEGRVIVLTSSASQSVRGSLSAYHLGKATQNRFVAHLASEGRDHGVHAWAVHPGAAYTSIFEDAIASVRVQRYVPELITYIERLRGDPFRSQTLDRCAEFCADLAAGARDGDSGRYLTVSDRSAMRAVVRRVIPPPVRDGLRAIRRRAAKLQLPV